MKFHYIDSIRGIAILMVILVHTAQSTGVHYIPSIIPAYGQMGVQLFFIASAFTLCHSADTRRNESHHTIKYAIRRYFRIAPAYYIGIIGYLALDGIINLVRSGVFTINEKYTVINLLANFLFVHGFIPSANNNIVPGGWSIGTEMAFYCIFPAFFWTINSYVKPNVKGICLALSLCLAASVLSFILLYLLTGKFVVNNNFLYFSLFNQFPVFATGICYYHLWHNGNFQLKPAYSAFLYASLSLVAVLLWRTDAISFAFNLVPFVSGVSFVFLMDFFRATSKLRFGMLERIGTVSYSMYLIHFVFAHQIAGRISERISNIIGPDFTLVILFSLIVMFTYSMAVVSEILIEKPSIKFGKWLIGKLPA